MSWHPYPAASTTQQHLIFCSLKIPLRVSYSILHECEQKRFAIDPYTCREDRSISFSFTGKTPFNGMLVSRAGTIALPVAEEIKNRGLIKKMGSSRSQIKGENKCKIFLALLAINLSLAKDQSMEQD